jgi:hypothetical protein
MIIQNFPFIRGLLVDKREIVCYTVIYVKKNRSTYQSELLTKRRQIKYG